MHWSLVIGLAPASSMSSPFVRHLAILQLTSVSVLKGVRDIAAVFMLFPACSLCCGQPVRPALLGHPGGGRVAAGAAEPSGERQAQVSSASEVDSLRLPQSQCNTRGCRVGSLGHHWLVFVRVLCRKSVTSSWGKTPCYQGEGFLCCTLFTVGVLLLIELCAGAVPVEDSIEDGVGVGAVVGPVAGEAEEGGEEAAAVVVDDS